MNERRIADVVQVVLGKLTVEVVAQRHEVGVAEVETWKAAYLAGLEGASVAARGLRPRRWPAAVLAALVLVGLSSRVSFASGSACGETLPSTLTPFCPDTPALSAQVNQNYRDLITYIESKVGSISSPDLPIAGNISAVRFNPTSAALGATVSTTIANDSTSSSLVIAGRGTSPTRKVTLRDDVAITGNLNVTGAVTVTGSLSGGNVSGTIVGGGQLLCSLGTINQVQACAGTFGSVTCPAFGSVCSTSTRITCPAGTTARDTERNCTNSGVVYPCFTTSWCVRD